MEQLKALESAHANSESEQRRLYRNISLEENFAGVLVNPLVQNFSLLMFVRVFSRLRYFSACSRLHSFIFPAADLYIRQKCESLLHVHEKLSHLGVVQ